MEELTRLRAQYEPNSPPVLKVVEEAEIFRAAIAKELSGEPTEEQILRTAQVPSAALLYQEYAKLKQEEFAYEEGIVEVTKALNAKKLQMSELPLIAGEFREVKDERDDLVASQNAFRQRLDQVEFYANEQTPGYLKVFQPADFGIADLSTGKLKTIASGLLLGSLALATMFLWSLLREIRRPEMRTMLQGAITTQATPKFALLQKDEMEDEAAINEFWLTQLSRSEDGGRRILFPIVGELKSEFLFWRTLLQCIKRNNSLVLYIDVAQEPVPDSFLKANLLPFTPPSKSRPTASSFLQSGGTGSEDLWKGTAALAQGNSESGGSSAALASAPPLTSIQLTDQPQSGASLTNILSTRDDQPLIPYAGDVTQSARYVSAADYSTEQLGRWAIGPTSSLAAISKHFDQHYLLNSPVNTHKKVAASQSRIFRRILGVPNGILFLNEQAKGFFYKLVHRIESAYFHWNANDRPAKPRRESASADDDRL